MKLLFQIFILVSITTSCDPYGVNKSTDFGIIESELINSFNAKSVQIDDDINLVIKTISNQSENSLSSELLSSLIFNSVAKNYNPNVLSLDKLVDIQIIDSIGQSFQYSMKIRDIFKLQQIFNTSFKAMSVIFNTEKDSSKVISDFKRSNCYLKFESDNSIKAINIIGIHKKSFDNGTHIVYMVASGRKDYPLFFTIDNKNEILAIECRSSQL